jgi:hypothetical protein
MGRLGPHYATTIGSNEMWNGGDIFPSGHTANAVVTWGILAYLASTPRARRWLSAVSAVTSLGVGLTTVYLGTHWLSDVVLGWTAGLLILLGLPWCEPLIARAEVVILDLRDRWRDRLLAPAPASSPAAAPSPAPAASPAPVAASAPSSARSSAGGAEETGSPAREAVTGPRATRSPVYLAPGPHTTRSERTPVTPAGSRRPPHPERTPRAAAGSARPLGGG